MSDLESWYDYCITNRLIAYGEVPELTEEQIEARCKEQFEKDVERIRRTRKMTGYKATDMNGCCKGVTMFEKEAEEYAIGLTYPKFQDNQIANIVLRDVEGGFVAGAEFGYNKAKEEIRKELLGRRPDNE